jgi:septum formation protein
MTKPKFILASQSPRRRELLASMGVDFVVIPSHIPEEKREDETAEEYVARLSREKAAEVAREHPSEWIIAADTTVLLGDELLEKPQDVADARRMLATISGKTHLVYTGVTLLNTQLGHHDTRVTTSEVRMLALSESDIAWYVNTGEPMDKAGSYAVQGIGSMFIDSVHGNYTNVVGLPLATLFRMLRKAGIDPLYNPEAHTDT